ncbi:MAG TPA: helix-turn-helix domain-containing protein [Rhizomicrobium sp.]|jgi:AcrR family transcriptional regulator
MDAVLPRRQRVKQQNRRFILDAARKVFAERGYDAATVRDIINATPLAAGTFYNYFTSKDEVRRALETEMAEALRPRLAEGRSQAATAEEFLSAFFSAVFALKSDTGPDLERADLWAGFDDLRTDIEAGIVRGLFLPLDAAVLAAALLASAQEASKNLARDGGDPVAATAAMTLLFLRGVQPPI